MKNTFENIKLSQLHTLYRIITESNFRKIDYIKRKYSESGLAFHETLTFLELLGIVENNSGVLESLNEYLREDVLLEEFKSRFLETLFTNKRVANNLQEFLSNFKIENNTIVFHATYAEKIKYSDIKNLLIELNFISLSSDKNSYLINPRNSDLFLKQLNNSGFSIEAFKKKQQENEFIGHCAEIAVIEFELKRLVDINIQKNEIEHTSQLNTYAGFDIKSFENSLDNNANRILRYIEVKAVSIEDYKFFWSRNEIEIAKILGDSYFLYLLPVMSNVNFDFEKIQIIKNPFKNIYTNINEWLKKEESYSFCKISSN